MDELRREIMEVRGTLFDLCYASREYQDVKDAKRKLLVERKEE